jgi:hypothetical protein
VDHRQAWSGRVIVSVIVEYAVTVLIIKVKDYLAEQK